MLQKQKPTTDLELGSKAVLVNVANENVQPDILEILSRELKGQLIIAGLDLIDSKDEKINLNVNVIEFTPGNAALRLTIGLEKFMHDHPFSNYIRSRGMEMLRILHWATANNKSVTKG